MAKYLFILSKIFTSVSSVADLPLLFHIERGAHGVLNKNKKFAKNFISLNFNNLSQKISCGQGVIFARRAHIRAKGRGCVYLTWHGHFAHEK
jgi:hypothetical protein